MIWYQKEMGWSILRRLCVVSGFRFMFMCEVLPALCMCTVSFHLPGSSFAWLSLHLVAVGLSELAYPVLSSQGSEFCLPGVLVTRQALERDYTTAQKSSPLPSCSVIALCLLSIVWQKPQDSLRNLGLSVFSITELPCQQSKKSHRE